jgi:hypothetical protein
MFNPMLRWVHWTCAHSEFYITSYKTLYSFSSIPSEHRHQRFKRDLRNTCQAWKHKDPVRCTGYLKRCVEMDALDQGLRALKCRRLVGQDTLFKPTRPLKD